MTSVSENNRIAFIGLGMMGYPMAGRLAAAGYQLAVYDINSDTTNRFAREFACLGGSSAAQSARNADMVITMLPSSDDVFLSVLGEGSQPGILAALRAGTTLIDMSSSDPLRSRELAEILSGHQVTMVDAPVSGGVRRAQQGKLAIMFGGPKESLERCRPVLEVLGSAVYHTGETGTGHALKALNNYVSAASLVATVEALHTGRKFGIDEHVITQVLNSSTGKNNTSENKVIPFMLSGTFDSGFALHLMTKDITTAVNLADNLQIPAKLGHACLDIWRRAAASSERGTDHTEMYRILDSSSGDSIPSSSGDSIPIYKDR